ncbi:DUF4062 domain-containing protein [Gordonia alkaliphila]|uniref:DUF4062 domain-containing protein n=1 Tax=Gordonia alkaliphila TaxID=1053547 RepID=A0ABP8ZKQ2_9ACTN
MAVVPVFVSSTFRDFHVERDVLAGPVRERLDELVASLGVRVELIDLRWGVDTLGVSEDDAARRVLDVCLREVQRARPLFVGFVGDRFGFVPEVTHARAVAKSAGVPESQSVEGLSVTALEFGFGLLWDSAPDGDHVVVFRDVVGQVPADWADADRGAVQAFREEVAAGVADRSDVVVADYTVSVEGGVADLGAVTTGGGRMSFEDLMVGLLSGPVVRKAEDLARLEAEAGVGVSGSERLFRDDHAIVVGRDVMVAEVVESVAAGGRVVLVGESGSGKSTVVCAAEKVLRARGVVVVSSLLGASTVGVSGRLLVEVLAAQLSSWTGRDLEVPSEGGVEELSRWWRDVLADTVAVFGGFVMVVDALDGFVSEPERSDVWPVRGLPVGVGLLVSTTVPDHAQILEHEGADPVRVGLLPGAVAAEAANAWTQASGRQLPASVLSVIGTQVRSPLWVRLVVDLLGDLDADDFAAIAQAPDQAQAIADLLLAQARSLPCQAPGFLETDLVGFLGCQSRVGLDV